MAHSIVQTPDTLTSFVSKRSDALVESVRLAIEQSPERRVSWVIFDAIGKAMGLSMEVIATTMWRSFDVLALPLLVEVATNEVVPEEEAAAAWRALLDDSAVRSKYTIYFTVRDERTDER